MNKLLYLVVDNIFKLLPLSNSLAYFSSFSGLYNDNPKYISMKLHELYPHIKIIWVIDNRANKKDIPNYIVRVKNGTVKQLFYKNRSKILVDNGAGLMNAFKGRWNIRMKTLKKRGQLDYTTWHGTPLKKIGRDVFTEGDFFYSTTTSFVFNSEYIARIFRKSFSDKIPIHLLGSPRNDILFEKDCQKECEIRTKLGLPIDKKIVIYAPTYRSENDNTTGKAFSVYIEANDVKRCLEAFQSRFGGEWVLVYRVHQFVLSVMSKDIDGITIFNGNLFDDMAEYLRVSDALITDYSGSLFDYTLTGKPCFLYTPDAESYCGSRGIYIPLNELPYPQASVVDGLTEAILKYNEEEIMKKVTEFNIKLGMMDDGRASERIVKLIAREAKID